MQINMKIVLFILTTIIGSLVVPLSSLDSSALNAFAVLTNSTDFTALTNSTASTVLANSTDSTVSTVLTNSTASINSIVLPVLPATNFTAIQPDNSSSPALLPSLWRDLFVDRARMGLVPFKEEDTSLHIEYFDTPFERQYHEADIKHMISMSVRDTRDIIRPYHYHRFQQLPNSTTFRLHCKFMLNFISLGNHTWEAQYQNATNLMAYYRRLYENGDHTDLVCYFVDTTNQTEADCLLRLVTDPHGDPFPVVEYSRVRRQFKHEPKVSHYHPHNKVYCSMMESVLKLKTVTTPASDVFSPATTTTTEATTMQEEYPTSITFTTATPSSNFTIPFEPTTLLSNFTSNVTEDSKKEPTAPFPWHILVGAPILIFGIIMLVGGFLYKYKKNRHVPLDDSMIQFEVIRKQSGDSQTDSQIGSSIGETVF